MANYNKVSYGAQGSDVTQLQELLNQNGANLTVDGIFGNQTQQAVQQYQKDNGLTVDGVVGDQTWGALTGSSNASTETTTPEESSNPEAPDKASSFEYEAYKPSDTVAQAEALLQQHMQNKPGEYQSTWSDQLNSLIQQIMNRENFSYDLNGDALYQQYKDQYMQQGKLAMMDTMGQAAAMTGGYGNSYAQTAGQQAYQGYLQQLNNVVPELYGMALDQYNREGDAMYDQAALVAAMEDQDYGRYRDQLSNYYTELDRLTADSRYQAETDYGRWADQLGLDYGMYRDTIADQQWQAQFDEAQRQYNEQMALNQSKSSGGSSGSGDGGNRGSYDAEAARKQQELVNAGYNIAVDGIWGPQSQAAWEQYQNGGVGEITDWTGIENFHNSIHSESEHDAVMRDMYGSYGQYVAEQIENSGLTDSEKAFLISYYGITESDTNYKPRK